MFFEPASLFMLSVLVAVTGYVTKGVICALKRGEPQSKPASDRMGDMEERMRKIEVATSSLLVDMTGMREKQRFMARLGENSAARAAQQTPSPQQAAATGEGELSPMMTQNIPIIPRAGRSR